MIMSSDCISANTPVQVDQGLLCSPIYPKLSVMMGMYDSAGKTVGDWVVYCFQVVSPSIKF